MSLNGLLMAILGHTHWPTPSRLRIRAMFTKPNPEDVLQLFLMGEVAVELFQETPTAFMGVSSLV